MVEKRPFVEEEFSEVSNKHQRQEKHDGDGIIRANTESNESLGKILGDDTLVTIEDAAVHVPGSVSNSSWPTSSTSEEDSWPQEPLHLPLFPEYCNTGYPIRTLAHWQDHYSLLLDCPSRKSVPIGRNYQADVPAWDSQDSENILNKVENASTASNDGNEELMMGICLIPLPNLEVAYADGNVGSGRYNCSCEDQGSVRCVRQHILEARVDLTKSIGHEKFVELGFCDMGEVVAEKWSEEEELLFHKVVFSNPASLSRNFWVNLSAIFPSRTHMEIVSYYFNVFMLRKRAEQNRCESMNIDSDNDEWQGSYDSGNSEGALSNEDDDSVIESPLCQGDLNYCKSQENGLHIVDEDDDVADETGDNTKNVDIVNAADAIHNDHTSQVQDEPRCDEREQEVQDDSCTSSDTGAAVQDNQVLAVGGDRWHGNFNGLSDDGCNGYVTEPCDSKGWDGGYSTCQGSKMDFLPTCSMIEEVFGDGSWNYNARDGKRLN